MSHMPDLSQLFAEGISRGGEVGRLLGEAQIAMNGAITKQESYLAKSAYWYLNAAAKAAPDSGLCRQILAAGSEALAHAGFRSPTPAPSAAPVVVPLPATEAAPDAGAADVRGGASPTPASDSTAAYDHERTERLMREIARSNERKFRRLIRGRVEFMRSLGITRLRGYDGLDVELGPEPLAASKGEAFRQAMNDVRDRLAVEARANGTTDLDAPLPPDPEVLTSTDDAEMPAKREAAPLNRAARRAQAAREAST